MYVGFWNIFFCYIAQYFRSNVQYAVHTVTECSILHLNVIHVCNMLRLCYIIICSSILRTVYLCLAIRLTERYDLGQAI
jgi:hypothetical protein